ncbi:NirD/YgiW/YdeI family stress tolerance protein [Shinella sp. CPCC 101442]|uniref:YgiW/YdeI family stress tolerance OB fold protein n=1 Tax=Shinella sp. CPCC 101442 TaxID=2932265 RepID=UPI0021538A1D|nr:NirD/YgiW/YdeI family stress tolerance protein [Shinella sp. CPCC 101442]MCR6500461.1 NirD/YgiW/YdeI family stress tolerance protein [Shinella sp. CPCC 101442]
MNVSSASKTIYRAGKISLAAACVAMLLSGPVNAQFSGAKRTPDVTTVEQARAARHGARASLKGSLTKEVRMAQYLFRDKTGEIRVRIQRELWRGREITAKTLLRVRGKIQSDVRGRFVNVDYVQVLN